MTFIEAHARLSELGFRRVVISISSKLDGSGAYAIAWEAFHPVLDPDRLAAMVELDRPPKESDLEAFCIHVVMSAEKWATTL